MLERLQASAAPQAAQGRGKSRLKGASNVTPSFAWTPRAAEVLLRLRYDTMRGWFQGMRSPKQLTAAWKMLAAETFRLGGLEVDAGQCKSKLKHMHKQYTAYRAALEATGNATEKPLKEPVCYEAMRDVRGDLKGMDADALFSSDATSTELLEDEAALELSQSSTAEPLLQHEEDIDVADHEGGQNSSGWKRYTGKRARDRAENAEGMRAIGAGLNNIAEAFKVARVADTSNADMVKSMKELMQTVQAQTQALQGLIGILAANKNNE
ncbi:hypothetical protein PF002_g20155 [Phytophthora fragariae]|uniref:Myb/SANT-like DNA-binding domain-containing protein n=7 Tax=Phytophthora fragariae TaxID=53985 RepID=A0A6A3XP49_9STRA|nr:hypothetical protein PF002_g20155 [Phytophthora fragariae]